MLLFKLTRFIWLDPWNYAKSILIHINLLQTRYKVIFISFVSVICCKISQYCDNFNLRKSPPWYQHTLRKNQRYLIPESQPRPLASLANHFYVINLFNPFANFKQSYILKLDLLYRSSYVKLVARVVSLRGGLALVAAGHGLSVMGWRWREDEGRGDRGSMARAVCGWVLRARVGCRC